MSEIQAALSRLKAQIEQDTTLKCSLDEYNNLIRTQHDLTLSCHDFFTANAILDQVTGAAIEYPQLKLGESAKAWIRGCSKEIGRFARGLHSRMMSGSNTIHSSIPHKSILIVRLLTSILL